MEPTKHDAEAMLKGAGEIETAVRARAPQEHPLYLGMGLTILLVGLAVDFNDADGVASVVGATLALVALAVTVVGTNLPYLRRYRQVRNPEDPEVAGVGARALERRRSVRSRDPARRHHRLLLHPGGHRGRRAVPAVGPTAPAHRMTAHPRARLDDLVHQPVRFSLLAGLAQADELEFRFLRDTLQISDSLLSRQASTLEQAGYIAIRKGHVGKWPRTWLKLTPEGRTAFNDHLNTLREIVETPTDAP